MSSTLSREHLQAAADWHVRLTGGEPTAADRAAWQSWLDQAAEHRDAWQRVERLKDLLGQAPERSAQALERARGLSRRRVLAGVGLVGVAAAVHQALPWLTPTPTEWIATAPGQRREVRLPDGGLLLIGPASRVGIAYGRRERTLHLAQGALQLRTGSDVESRPLRVHLRDGWVRPLGTRFTLVQQAQDSVVAVQQHAVEVLPSAAKFPVRVDAGQRLRFSAVRAEAPTPAGFADEAWTRGVLVVVDQPLGDFLLALQAQSGIPLSCDPALKGLRVSGSFLAKEPARSLATLADQHRLRLERQGESWHLRSR